LITKILRDLSKITDRIGAIKCSINIDFTKQLITDQPEVVNKEGTDTARIEQAGSAHTILIKSNRNQVEDAFNEARKLLKNVTYLLIEGNSAVKYLPADLIVYLDREDLEMKKSAEEAKEKADIIINTRDLFIKKEISEIPFRFNLDIINCPKALLLATIMDRKPILIGKQLNKEKVKLKGCQLGFF